MAPSGKHRFRFANYASTKPRQLFGRPDWVCPKCSEVFTSYLKLKNHRWEKHVYVGAALVLSSAIALSISSKAFV